MQSFTAKRLEILIRGLKNLGLRNSLLYKHHKAITNQKPGPPFRMRSPNVASDLWCRPQTSDLAVFSPVPGHHGPKCLDSTQDVSLIIDCGANVRFSAAYFWPEVGRLRPRALAASGGQTARSPARCRTAMVCRMSRDLPVSDATRGGLRESVLSRSYWNMFTPQATRARSSTRRAWARARSAAAERTAATRSGWASHSARRSRASAKWRLICSARRFLTSP